ncbi:MAG TPA: pyrophosphate--fructose-6-phosphate 1-phosphotransferase [Lacunisphaera sp.]|jgi:pyrophosphate--fructose-6-phosphate 1-phosphotransferase|nr:pyrophosphate--fructose-6-phosphate 1-phosphotransferase [Lacunisphaera sp.]
MSSTKKKVAILTAGGHAPCLSAAVGQLILHYTQQCPDWDIICYRSGYKGLLLGESYHVTPEIRAHAGILREYGGSVIGNSRVKLTNVKDAVKRGLIKEGQHPLEVAAAQLTKDGVDILHTVGGDDTNTTAADLAAHLEKHNYTLKVIGLPKTIDNDIIPIRQSLGAVTAAEQGARFFANVVTELGASGRMLIVHEVMGRNCGWLTAATAREYQKSLATKRWVPGLGLARERYAVHAIYLPELALDIDAEAKRLRALMDRQGNINLFVSEGAGLDSIIAELTARGEEVARDAFGHVRIDTINPGKWFAERFAKLIGAEKVLVQKSGYFARSAPANAEDFKLIDACVLKAVECARAGITGLVGQDEERGNELRAIEFPRIKGGKAFDATQPWFQDLLQEIGQPMTKVVAVKH